MHCTPLLQEEIKADGEQKEWEGSVAGKEDFIMTFALDEFKQEN